MGTLKYTFCFPLTPGFLLALICPSKTSSLGSPLEFERFGSKTRWLIANFGYSFNVAFTRFNRNSCLVLYALDSSTHCKIQVELTVSSVCSCHETTRFRSLPNSSKTIRVVPLNGHLRTAGCRTVGRVGCYICGEYTAFQKVGVLLFIVC